MSFYRWFGSGAEKEKVPRSARVSGADRAMTEPLGTLGGHTSSHLIDVSSAAGSAALSAGCTRYTIIARGGDARVCTGDTAADASISPLLQAGVERDYACPSGTVIHAVKAAHEAAATVVVEIIEIVEIPA